MTRPDFALAVFAGAVLALPYVLYAQRTRRSRVVFGAGLIVAAAVYVVFAAVAGEPGAVAIETGGLAVFGAIAAAGIRWSQRLLVFGWGAHMLWDLLLHPVGFAGHAPWWYPAVCVGFDLLVAGYILGASGASRTRTS